jgi:hypothetical protein
MQRTIHKHGVDFEVEFTEGGEVDAIYIGAIEVSKVIRESTERAIISDVMMHSADWYSEYRREMADEMRRAA